MSPNPHRTPPHHQSTDHFPETSSPNPAKRHRQARTSASRIRDPWLLRAVSRGIDQVTTNLRGVADCRGTCGLTPFPDHRRCENRAIRASTGLSLNHAQGHRQWHCRDDFGRRARPGGPAPVCGRRLRDLGEACRRVPVAGHHRDRSRERPAHTAGCVKNAGRRDDRPLLPGTA